MNINEGLRDSAKPSQPRVTAQTKQELVREICIFGSPAQQRERLEEFVARGVQTPILTPVCPPDQVAGLLEAWAPYD